MEHAYQTTELIVFDDGVTYTPLMQMMNASYKSETDIFHSYYKGRGLADCGEFNEYKLIDRKMVLQKTEEDNECDGEMKFETTFDINQQ